ncbi:S9 family peptidase [Robiginitalea aurantiaca]|uniref:S9 family peptidase n=1 Tax=Robiginitalea aurantiaca TaxID=3056915 RepID=A0ABT7WDX9_9FLAO|nr:S9 family peptidase [Robiginitalea aurantiaca]MDM9631128.1 S9 family peptidase [Robiginitalea aurantiaca]
MQNIRSLTLCLMAVFLSGLLSAQKKNPSFEEVISLQSVSNPVISPDGRHVVFEKSATDWAENRFDRELWLSKDQGAPFPLTNNPSADSRNPKWSPDGKWISFVSRRGDKNQIHVMRSGGGEAFQLTDAKEGVSSYEWSPDGKRIAFLQSEDKGDAEEAREKKYGEFMEDEAEYELSWLWVVDFKPERFTQMPLPQQMEDSLFKAERKPKALLDSVPFTINEFQWSPDGTKIAIEHQPDPLINSFFKADISIYDVASGTHKPLIANPSYDGLVDWSPDSKSILYQTNLNDSTSNYYKNNKLFRIDIDGSGDKQLAADFDENINNLNWTPEGIYGTAWQKTKRPIVRIDPKSGKTKVMTTTPDQAWSLNFDKDGKNMVFGGRNYDSLGEIWTTGTDFRQVKQITENSSQISGWATSQSEVIQWKSEDGAQIEGVLHKPADYDPSKKYPLLVVIHGGPTGISTPQPVPAYVYPILQWLNKGALVLMPNYRGSAGYGEEFRSLNVQNLGVGDAWDVLSGVAHMEKQGLIDPTRMGSMGWSQGGYISAFLTTNSDRFKAISVGAGISNWVTYYVNTDIHPFTRQYLKATPWEDMEVYERTSPMTNISKASTPTLIQHGENDRRVPIANAYELVQGLRDQGVDSKLIVYKGFGHGITKPKERLAATWHNWQWFGKYIWGEEIEMGE